MNIYATNNLNFGKIVHAIVGNQHGLHFAPSAAIAEITRKVGKPIYFSHAGDTFEKNIKGSPVGLTIMEFTKGDEVIIRVADDYPDYALKAVVNCVSAYNNEGLDYVKKSFYRDYYSRLS